MAGELKKGRAGQGEERPEADRSFKEFWPTSFAIDHRTSVLVLFVIIALGGILTYRAIPQESFPEIELPMIAINTIYPGVSPADIETLVTRPIEEELNTIADLKELTSTSVEGYSSILAEFETSVTIEDALASVREKVDLARPDLPADTEDPTIVEFDFSEVPVMQVNLSADYGLVRLKEVAEDLQDEIESIPAVLRADLRGGLEREVKVDVDLARLQYYGIALSEVVEAIQFENVNIPGGAIDVGALKYLVRVDGEFDDPMIIEDLVVTTFDGRPVYVRDVADVEFGFAERESFARLDDNPVITLDVIKRSGEHIIEAAEAIRAAVDAVEPEFPTGTVVTITSDQSEQIEVMVSSLENNIVSGLILIIGVLLFFLGLRTSLFVAVSIPMSMLLSFIVIGLLGITMNMIVLFSLILALGMLVDNAIVIVENIYRYLEEGWDRATASKKATGEVAGPVIAATLTTLAAFGPLLFWPGMMGSFMGYLPQTLIITLSSSLFVAIIIIPTLCSMFIRLEDEPRKPMTREARWTLIGAASLLLLVTAGANVITAIMFVVTAVVLWAFYHFVVERWAGDFQFRFLPWLTERYEASLRWALAHRAAILGITVATFVGSVAIYSVANAGSELFPEDIPPKQAMVDIEAPVGTSADFTNGLALRLEEEIKGVTGIEDAESIVATVGGGGGGGNPMEGGASGPNAGRLMVSFVDYQDQQYDAFETLTRMQESMGADLAGAEVSVDKPNEGPPTGPPVNVEIIGEDPDVLQALSDDALRILENSDVFPKLVGLESDLDAARSELQIAVDREKAGLYGLNTFKVANAVRGAVQGVEAAKYRTGNEEYDIVVRLAEEYREDLSSLENLTVMNEGRQIPITSVAEWTVDEGYGSIRRKDMDRMATLSAEVVAGLNSTAVLGEVQAALEPFASALPPGYEVRYTGEQEDQAEATEFLSSAFIWALALIAFILISQFNSVVKPVIILTSVLMSTVGVLLGLVLFRMPFGIIMTGVGIISLAGIVVNNAIVLIDYIDILRERDGMDRKEAVVQGGKTRLRPVLLTAITTALGLVPLAIGLNFDFFGLYQSLSPELFWGGEQAAWWGPMAVAVIVGILFATLLTLILVPVMYSLVEDFAAFFRRHYTSDEDGADPEQVVEGAGDSMGGTDGSAGGRTGGSPDEPTDAPVGEPAPSWPGPVPSKHRPERQGDPVPTFRTGLEPGAEPA